MKKIFVLCCCLWVASFLSAQKPVTLEDCFQQFKFYPQIGKEFFYLNDGQHYANIDRKGMHIRDIRNESKDSLIKLDLPDNVRAFDQFEFSDDESKLLLRTETEPVYRHSVLANYYVYDFQTKKTAPVYKAEKQQFVALSPDAKSVAFVAGNNLYIKDLMRDTTIQVTYTGMKGLTINGHPDWLYEEEFSPIDGEAMVATRWSPDSKWLAYIQFEEVEVPEMPLTQYENGAYPSHTFIKYPKVGEANSLVGVHLYHVASDVAVGEVMGIEPTDYVPRIDFTPNNQLVVTRLNRNQDTLDLLIALPDRVIYDQEEHKNYIATRLLLEETDPAYVDVDWQSKITFLKSDPQHFLWASERSGYQHIWRLPMDQRTGETPASLTQGKFDVTAFYGINEKTGKIYYQAATPTPIDRQIWEGDLAGGTPRLLTYPLGTHEANFSPTFEYMQHTWSDANTPPVVAIRNTQIDTFRVIIKNERVKQALLEYGFSKKEFFQFPLEDGTMLNGWMIRPAVMDSARKYPVLFDNYGGPGSQTVLNQYDGYTDPWRQLLAQNGYVIVSVDNRGTGGRGSHFKKCTQLQLGKLETEDQIAAARYLASLPWVDAERIGIWGWSYGGFLSTSCILKGNETFKMAMAVAPVSNWEWYNSAYTERYMHTTKHNETGYQENSPIHFAERLKGDNFLICHGMTDDNVHWQQTTEMINALIKANKQFETYYYPNQNHNLDGNNATMHLFRKLTNFVLEKL